MRVMATIAAMILFLPGCAEEKRYAAGCGPIPDGWITPRQGRGVNSLLNTVSVVGDGSIVWNETVIPEVELFHYLKLTNQLQPTPVTQIKFAPTVECDAVRRLRLLVANNLDCSYGRCAEGSGKWWLIGDVVFEGVQNEPFDPDAPPR